MPMMFEEKLAVMYGLEEAIILQNLMFWIKKNRANSKHFHDGRYWTYNSAKAFETLFPFWNRAKIYRILESLEKQGAIFCGNYNDVAYDRTRWYAVKDEILDGVWSEKCMLQNDDFHVSEMQLGSDESATPIPDGNPDCIPDINTIRARFEIFYKAYPKKRKPGDAEKAWNVIKPDGELLKKMLDAISAAKQTTDWTKEGGKFIPYPASWLRGKGWEDEINPTTDGESSYGYRRI